PLLARAPQLLGDNVDERLRVVRAEGARRLAGSGHAPGEEEARPRSCGRSVLGGERSLARAGGLAPRGPWNKSRSWAASIEPSRAILGSVPDPSRWAAAENGAARRQSRSARPRAGFRKDRKGSREIVRAR